MTTAATLTTHGNNRMTVNSAQVLEQAHARLKALAGQQQELADTREKILIGRESLDRKGKQVRLLRDRTADAEVAFMNVLRKHYNSSGAAFPAEVDAAYSKVDAERTRLGLFESEHLEAEEDLGGQEWSFMEQENDLYQYDLQQIFIEESTSGEAEAISAGEVPSIKHPEIILPSTVVQYQVARVEHNRLIDRFKTMRKLVADIIDATTLSVDEAELLALGTPEFAASFSELLSQIAACEARLQHLQPGRDKRYGKTSHQASRASEPLPITRKLDTSFDTASRACSDTVLPDSNDQIPVIHRIREWLLDCLNQNALEKAQYISILQYTLGYLDDLGSEFPDWEVLAAQAWSHDDETDPTEAAQSLEVVPFSTQKMNEDNDAYDEAIRGDRSERTSEVLFPKAQQLPLGSSNNLLEGFCLPSAENLPSISEARGPNHPSGSVLALPDPQSDNLSSWEDLSEHEQISPTRSYENDSANPIINLAIVPNPDARRDSTRNCSTRRFDIVQPPVHASCNQRCIEKTTSQDLKDALTQGDRAILPIPDIVYSPPQWSVDLKCFCVLGLAADGNVAEVFWSKDRLNCFPDVEADLTMHIERTERCKSDDGTGNDLLYDHRIRCPWINFWRNHVEYLDTRYYCVSDLEQAQFFVSGRVFSTMRRCVFEKDGPLSDLMALRKQSSPLAQYEQHWFRFCFMVLQNEGTFSRCLTIQSPMGHHVSRRPPTGEWGIIYTSEDPPSPYPWETLSKAPLRVNPINDESLPAFSRIYYNKTFSVEHDFPILGVGLVLTQELEYTLSSYPEGVLRLDGKPCNISEKI